MSYVYYNANQFGNDVLDCSVRTLSVVEGISWTEAYSNLCQSARDSGLMMDSVEAVEEYLDRYYERVPIDETTVGEFIDNHQYRNICNYYAKSHNST